MAGVLDSAVQLYLGDLIEYIFFMLVKECEETAPVFPYWKYDPFSLENMLEDECLSEFRVSKLDIPRLLRVLRIPREIVCENGTKVSGLEGLCILLKRFTYPCRYSDLIPRFARSKPETLPHLQRSNEVHSCYSLSPPSIVRPRLAAAEQTTRIC